MWGWCRSPGLVRNPLCWVILAELSLERTHQAAQPVSRQSPSHQRHTPPIATQRNARNVCSKAQAQTRLSASRLTELGRKAGAKVGIQVQQIVLQVIKEGGGVKLLGPGARTCACVHARVGMK